MHYSDTRALDEAHLAALGRLLSRSERARQNRLWRATDRRDYAAAHALLRMALANHIQQPPGQLVFSADRNGKPRLASGSGVDILPSFNLTHACGLVACAIAPSGSVGIDVEPVNPAVDALTIARRYFSADEAAALERCPREERASRFCELWTLKEAHLKALGTGLAFSLSGVSFTVEEQGIRFAPMAPGERWAFVLIDVESGAYKLALAIDDRDRRRLPVCVTKVDLLEPDAWSS